MEPSSAPIPPTPLVSSLVARRGRARLDRDWSLADDLKRQLRDLCGVDVVDLKDGTSVTTPVPSPGDLERQRDEAREVRAAAARAAQRRAQGHGAGGPGRDGQEGQAAEGPASGGRMRSRRNRARQNHQRSRKARGGAFAQWIVDTFARELRRPQRRGGGGGGGGGDVDSNDVPSTSEDVEGRDDGNSNDAGDGSSDGGGVAEVLDVAGGSGVLAWELAMNFDLRATIVDPQPVRLSQAKTRRVLLLGGELVGEGEHGASEVGQEGSESEGEGEERRGRKKDEDNEDDLEHVLVQEARQEVEGWLHHKILEELAARIGDDGCARRARAGCGFLGRRLKQVREQERHMYE